MPVQRPLSGPNSVRLVAVALAAVAGVSFANGLSRQVSIGPRGSGRSGQVVVIKPQPQIVAWQQGYDPTFGAPVAAPAAPRRRHHAAVAAEDSEALPPAVAAVEAGQDAAAQAPATPAAPAPAAPADEPPADTPATP